MNATINITQIATGFLNNASDNCIGYHDPTKENMSHCFKDQIHYFVEPHNWFGLPSRFWDIVIFMILFYAIVWALYVVWLWIDREEKQNGSKKEDEHAIPNDGNTKKR